MNAGRSAISFNETSTPSVTPAPYIAGIATAPPGPGPLHRGVERGLRTGGLDHRVVLPGDRETRAERVRGAALVVVPRLDVDVHSEVAQDGDAAQADRARADDEHARAVLRVEAVDAMQRDRERLDQARVTCVDARRQRDEARRVDDDGVRHPAVAEEAVDRGPQDATQLFTPGEAQVAGPARRVG